MTTGPEDPFAFPDDDRDRAPVDVGSPPAGPPEPTPTPDASADFESRPPEGPRVPPLDLVAGQTRVIGRRWLAAVVAVLAAWIAYTVITGNRRVDPRDLPVGARVPTFAAPLATKPKLEFDAVNLAEEDDQGADGRVAACSIGNPSVVTSCSLLRGGVLVLAVVAPDRPACISMTGVLERVRGQIRGVGVLTVLSPEQHAAAARLARSRGWRSPVAYDLDGELGRRLGGQECQVLVVRRDGVLAQRLVGVPDPARLAAAVRTALAASRPPG